jgi:hypothetical protein
MKLDGAEWTKREGGVAGEEEKSTENLGEGMASSRRDGLTPSCFSSSSSLSVSFGS